MFGGGGMFPHDPRRDPEDMEAIANERRSRMSGNFRMTSWERWVLLAIGAVVGAIVVGVLFLVVL